MRTAIVLIACAGALAAQTPQLTNARLETKAAGGDPLQYLHHLVASESGPLWFGYAIETDRQDDNSCCWVDSERGCYLEGGRHRFGEVSDHGPVQLEGSHTFLVLYRVEDHQIQKIHPVSAGCPLDAGGLRFLWITGVDSKSSVALLSEQVPRRELDVALLAIGMHKDGGADVLIHFAKDDPSRHVRGQALFWLGQKATRKAVGAIQDAVDNDPDTEVKKKAVFALSQLPKDEGVPLLIQTAKTHKNPEVRKQAMFWLGQSGDPRALAFFQEILTR